ncbi:S8 family peptidase [Marisediminicola sp. LYQ85]|uniref:S8 family peptidase n=1 Tax=Marisediminicola sp. LYQ85 TaxID=3391062 RepID=UPI00398312FC
MTGASRRGAALVALVAVVSSTFVVALPAAADEVRDRQYWLADYGISDAWSTTRGAGVTVAVIDTGVDGSHPDLVGTVVGGTDVSGVGSADGQTPVGDGPEHGTMVASLLAGQGHGPGGGDGVIGVAPEAKILAVSVGFGVGTRGSDEQIADAVRWSVDNGADVINMSLTRNTLEWPESWDDAFLYAMENDVVVVAAAGNRGSGTSVVGAPATMPGVLTVAGVDETGRASFDASSQGITISVSAPSEGLVGAAPDNEYRAWAGTSGAAPLVSGLVALVRSAYPDLDATNVINRVIRTVDPVGSTIPSPIYGYGLINASKAVGDAVAPVDANPMGDLAEWIRVNRRADAPDPSTEAPDPAPAPGPPVTTASEPVDVGNPLGVVLPTVESVRAVGIPLLVIAVFAAGFGVSIGGLVRALVVRRRKTAADGRVH